ncbi:aminotransferase class IV [uncultured Sulfuricurvum sp.]|uniref:aminotransferase class IV n=1 Tax=uncultured Sulfuricurvum sp. TaxID=430693 RepID=UPI002621120E|nr:aminotransferase class IV [uncultured Sulfuricurvum sp.]
MFLETIRCEDGKALYLSYHQARMEHALEILEAGNIYSLQSLISPPEKGTFRCRFLYDRDLFQIEYHPYTPKAIRSLKAVHSNDLSYPLKSTERQELDALFARRGQCDDVLIIRNGFLSDTTIANIALKIKGIWLTPNTPLLPGTTRERLIRENALISAPLRLEDIPQAESIAVMNAMIGFVEIENGIIV